MLVPKRVKHRREFRGKLRGHSKGGNSVLSVNMAYKPLIHIGSLTDKLKLVVLPSPVV